jgi:Arc/MetJ-type ribon-helix-helix transcriptional regulator
MRFPSRASSFQKLCPSGGKVSHEHKEITITIDKDTLNRLDQLAREKKFLNRSRAIQEAVREKLERMKKSRLAAECAKLDPDYEKALAEEGLSEELSEWPDY